jgi:HK97 gp10 family phage protein
MAVQGLDKLMRKMALIPTKVLQEVRYSMERSATEMTDMMRRLVPVEHGILRDSIGWTWGNAPKGSMVIGQIKSGKNKGDATGRMTITIYAGGKNGMGTDAYYARFQEFGTVEMAANPFFYPSYRALRSKAKGGITRAVKKAMKAS